MLVAYELSTYMENGRLPDHVTPFTQPYITRVTSISRHAAPTPGEDGLPAR